MYKLQLLWTEWQGSHRIATCAFWPCGHEALLVLMLLDDSMHSGAYTKKVLLVQWTQQCGQRSIWNSHLYFFVAHLTDSWLVWIRGVVIYDCSSHAWKVLGFQVRCIISVLTTLTKRLWVQIAIIKSLLRNQYRNATTPFLGKPDFPKHNAL